MTWWWEVPASRNGAIATAALIIAVGWANFEAHAQAAAEQPAAAAEQPTTGDAPAEAAAEQPAAAAEQPTTGDVPAETDLLAPEQLDILVAPIALYPDPLLVLVLQGSTFPVEVVAANRFLGKLAEQPELQPDPGLGHERRSACSTIRSSRPHGRRSSTGPRRSARRS